MSNHSFERKPADRSTEPFTGERVSYNPMQQQNKQYIFILDTIAIHIKQTVIILYSSIDKINRPHNVQLILHSSIPLFYQKCFTNGLFLLGHIWSGRKNKNR